MIKNFKIFESQQSNDKEYFDAVANHYDEDLIQDIREGERMAFSIAGVRNAITEKTEGGNLLIRYVLGRKILCILGAVAKSGKMNRQDISDMKDWLNKAIDYLEDGYIIMTSPNNLSDPLITKLIKMAEDKGLELDVNSQQNVHQHGDMTWNSYMIRLA